MRRFRNNKPYYKSKFILDSFLLCVSTAKFLRRLAAIVDLFPRLHFCNAKFHSLHLLLTFVIFLVDRGIVPFQRADFEFLWKV